MRSLAAAAICLLFCFSACKSSSSVEDNLNGKGRRCPEKDCPSDATAEIVNWTDITNYAVGIDNTTAPTGQVPAFGQQAGPPRTARAMAIVHIAIFETVNAVEGGYMSYLGIPRAGPDTSVNAAIAQGAHDTLVALYSAQTAYFDAELDASLAKIPSPQATIDNGRALGRDAAARILALRANDGSQVPDPIIGVNYFPVVGPGYWSEDPVSMNPVAVGAYYSVVPPFVIQSATQFRIPPPPALTSDEYTAAFKQLKSIGGDGWHTLTDRTWEETWIGQYWGYDGTPYVGSRPNFYSEMTLVIANGQKTEGVALARLLALVHVSMADAALSAWESKYYYDFWRPVTAIRQADTDGNPKTRADPNFTPLGAPASNTPGPDFTPPFPAYPSGHAVFGGAVFQILRRFYRTDAYEYTFVSQEYNGITRDSRGFVRPYLPRTFTSFSQAEAENGQSRIYLGIHWPFDKTMGIVQGNGVGNYVYDHSFEPAP